MNYEEKFLLHVRDNPFSWGLGIYWAWDRGDVVSVARSVTFEDVPKGKATIDMERPPLALDTNHAQDLMDELWKYGVRPRELGAAGGFASQSKHLTDMRKIAFHKLGLKEDK